MKTERRMHVYWFLTKLILMPVFTRILATTLFLFLAILYLPMKCESGANDPGKSEKQDVEIVDQYKQYDYLDLVSSGYQVLLITTVRNKGNVPQSIKLTLNGQNNILSNEGKHTDLKFENADTYGAATFKRQGKSTSSNLQSLTIAPGEALNVYFKLIKPELQPATGTYKAYLVITDNAGTRITSRDVNIYVPSKSVIEANTFLKALVAWFHKWPEQISLSWWGRKLGVDSFLWDLSLYSSLLVLAFAWRGFILWCRRRHLGTIEIEKPVNATGDEKLKIEGLEALLKDTLEDLGLAPPMPQPIVSMGADLSSTLTTSGMAQTGAVKAAKETIMFVWNILWPRIGHKVALILRKSSNDCIEAIVEIKSAVTGKSEEIKAGITGNSNEDIIKKAAYFIFMHAMKKRQILGVTPKWSRFLTLDGFELYQKGMDQQNQGQIEAAIEDYQKAIGFEINNAIVLQSLGTALEERGRFLDAMENYLHTVTRWPEMIASRYRLAVMFSYDDQLLSEWNQLTKVRKDALLNSLRDYIANDASTSIDPKKVSLKEEVPSAGTDYFLKLAYFQWEYLIQELKWHKCFWRWLKTFNPIKWRRDIRDYLWSFAHFWPWGVYRRQYQCAAEAARYCTDIQIDQKHPKRIIELIKKVDRLLSSMRCLSCWRGVDWVVRYNAACAYSRALEYLPKEDYAKKIVNWEIKGVDLLDDVISDPESASVRPWLLKSDPDLSQLRKCSAFKIRIRRLGVTETTTKQSSAKQAPPDSLAQGWELLLAGARIRRRRWEDHQKTLFDWPKILLEIQLSEVRNWYQHETNIWTAIVELATNFGDSKNQKAFWDELMLDMERQEITMLPPLSEKTDDTKVMTYSRRWHQLAAHTRRLQRRWDHAEDEVRLALSNKNVPFSSEVIRNHIEVAWECWSALESWAKDPLDKTLQDEFLRAGSFRLRDNDRAGKDD